MNDQIEAISAIKKLQTKLQTGIGVTMGMILILIFFSFATLLDKMPSLFIYQAIIAMLIIIAFIFLKKISFSIVKFRFSGKEEMQPLLQKLKPVDLDKDPETIIDLLQSRGDV